MKRLKDQTAIIAIVLFCLFFTIAFYGYKEEENRIFQNFSNQINERIHFLNREINTNTESLYELVNYFTFSGSKVDNESFHKLAKSIMARHPSIGTLEWIPKITFAEREKLESEMHPYGLKFIIMELSDKNTLVPAPYRESYFPVYFMEPIEANLKAFGFNAISRPEATIAMKKARLEHKVYASEPVKLLGNKSLGSKESNTGVLIYLPLFDKNKITLKGYFLAIYRINIVMKSVLTGFEPHQLAFYLYDETNIKNTKEFFQYGNKNNLTGYKYRKVIDDVGGRRWVITASPSKEYIAAHRSWKSVTLLIVGTILIILLIAYIRVLNHKGYIEKLVEERTEELKSANQKLEKIALTDGLTGIGNRRFFDQTLQSEWCRAERQKSSLSVIIIDIDNFKLYNDFYGHPKGDTCLVQVVQCIQRNLNRASDFVARYGGEEFVVITPGPWDDAMVIAEKLCREVAALNIAHESEKTRGFITISIGVSCVYPNKEITALALVKQADDALYQAKNEGKNQACLYKHH